MKDTIRIGLLSAVLLSGGMALANEDHHSPQSDQGMMGSQERMQEMMEERMKMMKSSLDLTAEQERAFEDYAEKKKAMMKTMMEHRQSMKGGMKGGMGMQGRQGMKGQMGMMHMMSKMSFEERLEMMQKHGEQMLATSRAGRKFYDSLSPEQKKKLDEMPMQMKGMKMGQMTSSAGG